MAKRGRPAKTTGTGKRLSATEKERLERVLLNDGHSLSKIAKMFNISTSTVSHYKEKLMNTPGISPTGLQAEAAIKFMNQKMSSETPATTFIRELTNEIAELEQRLENLRQLKTLTETTY